VFSNLWVWGGIAMMALLQLLLTYWPPLNTVFQTAPIGLKAWGEIFTFAWISSLVVGLEKYWAAFHSKRATRSA
jgi:magnesium-transporting ATPase (P-type)